MANTTAATKKEPNVASTYQTARRTASELQARRGQLTPLPAAGRSLRAEDIADASQRVDELGRKIAIDFRSQSADEHVDDIGLRVEVIVPDVLQDHGLREHAARVPHQVFEQNELLALKLDLATAAPDTSRDQIEGEIADRERQGRFDERPSTALQRR